MTYKDNLQNHFDSIIERFEPARLLEGALSVDQTNELFQQQFILAEGAKWTPTSRNIQTHVDIDTLFERCPFLDSVMKEVLNDYYSHHSGNFYMTTQLHDAHVDLLTEAETHRFSWTQNVVPWKSCVIPLVITPYADAQTAFFNERHIGYSVTFDRVGASSQANSDYTLAREYPTLYDVDGNILETDIPNTVSTGFLFPQIPEGNKRGLSIETVLPFNVGDIMLFDACQIHASCVKHNKPNYKWLKSGINLQFYREV